MKTTVFFAFVCCLSVALISAEKQKCETNDDCDYGQCCIQLHTFEHKLCKNFRQNDDICSPHGGWINDDSDHYKAVCPCEHSLICVPEEVVQEGGVTRYINPRCLEKPAF